VLETLFDSSCPGLPLGALSATACLWHHLLGASHRVHRGEEGDQRVRRRRCLEGWWPDSVASCWLPPVVAKPHERRIHKAAAGGGQLSPRLALKRYKPGIVAVVDDLTNELLRRAAGAGAQAAGLCFSVDPRRLLGLDPVDRDACWRFRDLVPGPVSCVSPCQAGPYAKACQAVSALLRRSARAQKAQSAGCSW